MFAVQKEALEQQIETKTEEYHLLVNE